MMIDWMLSSVFSGTARLATLWMNCGDPSMIVTEPFLPADSRSFATSKVKSEPNEYPMSKKLSLPENKLRMSWSLKK